VPAPQLRLLGSWAPFPTDYLALNYHTMAVHNVDHDDCSAFHVQMWPLG